MPRSYEEMVRFSEALADDLGQINGDAEPATSPEEGVMRAAALRRARAEIELVKAVVAARAAGVPWARVGEAIGTSGETARSRYRAHTA